MVFLWGIIFSLGRAYVWLKFKSTPLIPPLGCHTHCSKCLYIVTYYHFQMSKHYKCAICGKYRLKHRRPIRTQSLKEYVEKTIGHSTNEDDVICSKCRSVFTDIFQIVVTTQLIRPIRRILSWYPPCKA